MSLPVGLGLWRLLTWALSPLARPYLRQRASRGKVVQSGSHADLMAMEGLYANLYRHNLEEAR